MSSKGVGEKVRTIGVLLVDDAPLLRVALENTLTWMDGVGLVTSVGGGIKALMYFDHIRPDLVLTTYEMPGMNGLQLAYALTLRSPETKVIITSRHKSPETGPDSQSSHRYTFIPNDGLHRSLPDQITQLIHQSAMRPPSRCNSNTICRWPKL